MFYGLDSVAFSYQGGASVDVIESLADNPSTTERIPTSDGLDGAFLHPQVPSKYCLLFLFSPSLISHLSFFSWTYGRRCAIKYAPKLTSSTGCSDLGRGAIVTYLELIWDEFTVMLIIPEVNISIDFQGFRLCWWLALAYFCSTPCRDEPHPCCAIPERNGKWRNGSVSDGVCWLQWFGGWTKPRPKKLAFWRRPSADDIRQLSPAADCLCRSACGYPGTSRYGRC